MLKQKAIVLTNLLIVLITISFSSAADIYEAAVSHKDRLESDIPKDERRKPLLILPFSQIKAGDKVLEIGAGGGYTTELLSRTVGHSGQVYAHFLYNKERLQDNRLPNVVDLAHHPLLEHKAVLKEHDLDDEKLDAIVIFFVFHDLYLNNEMHEELLPTFHDALKVGGKLIVLDNSAKLGTGLEHIGDLHRIDESFVKETFEQAGFELSEESNVLRNPEDTRTKPWGDLKGFHDRFAYRFVKTDGK